MLSSSGDPAALTDAALCDRLLAGDRAAFEYLVRKHHPALLRVTSLYVKERAVAEEVVQETWVHVLEGLSSFGRRSSLKTWIFRIAVNRAITRGQREGRTVPLSALIDAEQDGDPVDPSRFDGRGHWSEPPTAWPVESAEELAQRGEALAQAAKAIERLPPAQRAVLTLCDLEGVSGEEVCNLLSISKTNQRVLLHRARSRIRRELEAFFAPGST